MSVPLAMISRQFVTTPISGRNSSCGRASSQLLPNFLNVNLGAERSIPSLRCHAQAEGNVVSELLEVSFCRVALLRPFPLTWHSSAPVWSSKNGALPVGNPGSPLNFQQLFAPQTD